MAIILAENSCFLQKTTIKTKMYLVHAACQHFVYQLKSPFKKSGTDFLPVFSILGEILLRHLQRYIQFNLKLIQNLFV